MKLVKGQRIGSFTVSFPLKETDEFCLCRAKGKDNKQYFLQIIDLGKKTTRVLKKLNHSQKLKGLGYDGLSTLRYSFKEIINTKTCQVDAFDFISGEDLQSYVDNKGGCLSVYEAKEICKKLLKTISYLHNLEKPIIVNGLNIKSIIMDYSVSPPIPVIVDISSSSYLCDDITDTEFDFPFFVAPECFLKKHTYSTDVYSVGALLYYLIFGFPPYFLDLSSYPTEGQREAILEVRKRPLPLEYHDIYEFDDRLAEILKSSLSFDIKARISNASEFNLLLGNESEITHKTKEKRKPCKKKGRGFADVAGMSFLKDQLRSDVIDLLENPVKAKNLGLELPNGLLFYGPPGCGKSFFAEKFAEEVGCFYMYVKCSDVASPYIHGGQGKIADIFKEAEKNAPAIIFFDEVDSMLKDRALHTNVSESGEVNEFLAQLNNCGKRGIIAVAATNKPDQIDPAALRSGRLEYKYYIPAPDKETRSKIFEINLLKRRIDLNINFDELAEKTDGFISSDIKFIIDKAAREIFKSKSDKITMAVLLDVISKSKPSVSDETLEEYEQQKVLFNDGQKTMKRKIGFS